MGLLAPTHTLSQEGTGGSERSEDSISAGSCVSGAGDGTRTHDLPLTRRLLWPTELRQQSRQDTQPRTRATS